MLDGFQANSFQGNAFQAPSVVGSVPAFQANAFQNNAFQVLGGVLTDDVYYGDTRAFHHQDRFKRIERWFEDKPEASKIIESAAKVTREAHNKDYQKMLARYLRELEALAEDQAMRDSAKYYFNVMVQEEAERQDAEAAFLTLLITLF